MRRSLAVAACALLLSVMAAAVAPGVAQAGGRGHDPLAGVKHVVVIYEENHSFDNLWGLWPGVDGIRRPPSRTPRQTQVDRNGQPFECLLQDDVNLASLPPTCSNTTGGTFSSAFPNRIFDIGRYIAPSDTTCYDPTPPASPFGPANGVPKGQGLPGGCTRDLVHRFYQEQYQIDGGRMDRYTVGSDAVGLTQGYYDTRQLPLYQYLTGDRHAPRYVIADRFHQAAFGGSFLNHQWLVTAATPTWPGAVSDNGPNDLHSIVGADGHPNNGYLLHSGPEALRDTALTEAADATGACAPPAGAPTPPPGTVCGDWAVNTIQPTSQPFQPGTLDTRKLPPQHGTTIGDELSAKGISWAWYAGGWDNAAGNVGGRGWTNGTGPTCADPQTWATATFPYCPNVLFQFHHQPFNYYANYVEGAPGRSHLKDERDFLAAARAGQLPAVSFVKPVGQENEHPGYTFIGAGDRHLVDLIKAIQADREQWESTAIVVTYDEFGGAWDHVPPPTAPGVSDVWGPGTRIPAMVLSPLLPQQAAVDHTQYDTVSILAMIEDRFGLPALTSRDAADHSLGRAFRRGLPRL